MASQSFHLRAAVSGADTPRRTSRSGVVQPTRLQGRQTQRISGRAAIQSVHSTDVAPRHLLHNALAVDAPAPRAAPRCHLALMRVPKSRRGKRRSILANRRRRRGSKGTAWGFLENHSPEDKIIAGNDVWTDAVGGRKGSWALCARSQNKRRVVVLLGLSGKVVCKAQRVPVAREHV